MSPPGIRRCNPLNLRYTGIAWQGLANPPSEDGFCVFVDAIHGIRAAMVNMETYQRKYKLNTLAGLISRHAPPSENPTQRYIDYVCMKTNFTADDPVDMTNRQFAIPIIRAMAAFENGPKAVTYEPAIYTHAADSAGLS